MDWTLSQLIYFVVDPNVITKSNGINFEARTDIIEQNLFLDLLLENHYWLSKHRMSTMYKLDGAIIDIKPLLNGV